MCTLNGQYANPLASMALFMYVKLDACFKVSVTSTQAILLLVQQKSKAVPPAFNLVTFVKALVGKTCNEKIILNVYNQKSSSLSKKC